MVNIKLIVKDILGQGTRAVFANYRRRYYRYSYEDTKCASIEQYDASIMRLCHTIEKGLSYADYRAGFGSDNVDKLVKTLEAYASDGLDTSEFAYRTALSCLNTYIEKNRLYGHVDHQLNERVGGLPGEDNGCGGTRVVSVPKDPESYTYERLITTRCSIRQFSKNPVDICTLKAVLELAQHTPSACNRQGWRTRIITDMEKMTVVLKNQNGNRGFGKEIDKLLVVTADLRAQQRSREIFQAFVDGGMYAANIINSLYSKGIGSVPLSASLTMKQEENVRDAIGMDDAEVIILFIGVGNYPEGEFLSARSERRPVRIDVL